MYDFINCINCINKKLGFMDINSFMDIYLYFSN